MFNGRACPLNIPGTIVLTGNRQDSAGHAQRRQDGNVFNPPSDAEGSDAWRALRDSPLGDSIARLMEASGATVAAAGQVRAPGVTTPAAEASVATTTTDALGMYAAAEKAVGYDVADG